MTVPETAPQPEPTIVTDPNKQELNKRLEAISWGLFLIMIGGISFIPNDRVPEGLWSIGVGVILLGLNVARYFNHIRVRGFTTILGIFALLSGVGDFLGLDLPIFAILLIILGLGLVLKPWLDERVFVRSGESS